MTGATRETSAVIPKPLHLAMVLGTGKSSVGQVSLIDQMGIDMDEFNVFTVRVLQCVLCSYCSLDFTCNHIDTENRAGFRKSSSD